MVNINIKVCSSVLVEKDVQLQQLLIVPLCLDESDFNKFKNFGNCSYKLLKKRQFR